MKHLLAACLFALAVLNPAHAALKEKEVSYKAGEATMKGYLVYNDKFKGKRPGVLVVHEWWGHNEYARKRARMLADLGYTALALDMYGDGKQAHHPEEAGKFAADIAQNMDLARTRFLAARNLLQQDKTVDGKRLGAIGYCFGGAVVLEMARDGVDLKGVASFHGNLATKNPAQPGKIKARILVLNGADDPFVPAEQVAQFKQEMDAAGTQYQYIAYKGAKHSFTNPDADALGKEFNLPLEYNAQADRQSWVAMEVFFKNIFKKTKEAPKKRG